MVANLGNHFCAQQQEYLIPKLDRFGNPGSIDGGFMSKKKSPLIEHLDFTISQHDRIGTLNTKDRKSYEHGTKIEASAR
jgi:hypothetical protein